MFLAFTTISLPMYIYYFAGGPSSSYGMQISDIFSSFSLGNIGQGKLLFTNDLNNNSC